MPRRPRPEGELLERAAKVFVEFGYAATTTRRLAKALQVHETTLFRRFGSKAGLLRAVLESDQGGFGGVVSAPSGDLHADLCQIVNNCQRMLEHQGGLVAMLMREVRNNSDLVEVAKIPQSMDRRIVELIAHYQARGELLGEDPLQAAAALLAPLMLAGILRDVPVELKPGPVDPEEYVTRYLLGRGAHDPG